MAVFVFGSTGAGTVTGGGGGVIPSPLKSVFADNTWEEIIRACQENTVPDTWLVGDQKIMTINGVEYTIDIIGKNHDVYSDGTGAAPLTFQMHDVYKTTHMMHSVADNSVGWVGCDMRVTTLPSIFNLMPSEVQTAIREVIKVSMNTSGELEATNDKLFLLSEFEAFGGVTYSRAQEGILYEYYTQSSRLTKYIGSNANDWWLRSIGTNATSFLRGSTRGGYRAANTLNGIAFAFCF